MGGSIATRSSSTRWMPARLSPERTSPAQRIANGQNWSTRVIGATLIYQDIHSFHVAVGYFISDQQEMARSSVIVLGATVAQNLFGDSDPIGQTVRVSVFG